MKQSYKNHKKYYIPHHFIFLPVLGVLLAIGTVNALKAENNIVAWRLFSVAIACILYLAIMTRQHYALGNQDRIVRLEFRLRYFELLGKSAGPVEKQLSFSHISALRFSDDNEFITLLNRALLEDITADEIKRSIHNWQPDHERV